MQDEQHPATPGTGEVRAHDGPPTVRGLPPEMVGLVEELAQAVTLARVVDGRTLNAETRQPDPTSIPGPWSAFWARWVFEALGALVVAAINHAARIAEQRLAASLVPKVPGPGYPRDDAAPVLLELGSWRPSVSSLDRADRIGWAILAALTPDAGHGGELRRSHEELVDDVLRIAPGLRATTSEVGRVLLELHRVRRVEETVHGWALAPRAEG